jgi:hypothetical protein
VGNNLFRKQKKMRNSTAQRSAVSPVQTSAAVLALIVACLTFYIEMPTLAPNFTGFWAFGIWFVVLLMLPSGYKNPIRFVGVTAGLITCFGLVSVLVSGEMIHSSAYYNLLGRETTVDFNDALPPIDIEQAPLVSSDMALQAMQKRLSDRGAMGSQVEIGRPVKQLVDGKLVWVAFLEHRSLFKWFHDKVTPGYAIVSAHDPADVRIVTDIGGVPLQMRYLDSAYFGDDVRRHAYMSGHQSVGLTDFTPEIDDTGRPYYVATTYGNTIGLSGADATGVIIIDVQSGETRQYSITETPKWVDRIQPEQFVHEQLEDRGNYIHGWYNPSDEGRTHVADDLDLVYGTDGRAYWVAGMTTKGTNNGLTALYFIDTHTKAVRMFKVSAVTQETAKHGMENVSPEKHYVATLPLPFKVAGVPTYVAALRDTQGVSRAYGMVDMRNNQLIAVGDTLTSTLRLYQSKRSTDRSQADVGTQSALATASGTVDRISAEYRNNQTTYYLTLTQRRESKTDHAIFAGTSDLSEEMVLTKPGDTVELVYSDSKTRVMGLIRFRNLSVTPVQPAQ